MKNLSIVLFACRRLLSFSSASPLDLRGVVLSSVREHMMVLIATNAWVLTATQEKQLIKRCDKINQK